jgi:hypothetical protein
LRTLRADRSGRVAAPHRDGGTKRRQAPSGHLKAAFLERALKRKERFRYET